MNKVMAGGPCGHAVLATRLGSLSQEKLKKKKLKAFPRSIICRKCVRGRMVINLGTALRRTPPRRQDAGEDDRGWWGGGGRPGSEGSL